MTPLNYVYDVYPEDPTLFASEGGQEMSEVTTVAQSAGGEKQLGPEPLTLTLALGAKAKAVVKARAEERGLLPESVANALAALTTATRKCPQMAR